MVHLLARSPPPKQTNNIQTKFTTLNLKRNYTNGAMSSLLSRYKTRISPETIHKTRLSLGQSSPFHLRFRRNYQPKECYHCPKGRFQEHESCKILDRLFNKATNTCQCTAPVPDINLQQLTEDEEESDISDINENS